MYSLRLFALPNECGCSHVSVTPITSGFLLNTASRLSNVEKLLGLTKERAFKHKVQTNNYFRMKNLELIIILLLRRLYRHHSVCYFQLVHLASLEC